VVEPFRFDDRGWKAAPTGVQKNNFIENPLLGQAK
jgi:hypothetical protein